MSIPTEWLFIAVVLAAGLYLIMRGGLGRLPGDVRVARPGCIVNAPIASSCLVSVVLSIALSVALSFCAAGLGR